MKNRIESDMIREALRASFSHLAKYVMVAASGSDVCVRWQLLID
jgi:hypothetical protein